MTKRQREWNSPVKGIGNVSRDRWIRSRKQETIRFDSIRFTGSEEDIFHQLGDGRTFRWIQLQHVRYHIYSGFTHVRRRLVLHLLDPSVRLSQARGLEGWFAHKQSVHYASDAPYIGLVRMPDLGQYFRRYVVRCAADSPMEEIHSCESSPNSIGFSRMRFDLSSTLRNRSSTFHAL